MLTVFARATQVVFEEQQAALKTDKRYHAHTLSSEEHESVFRSHVKQLLEVGLISFL